jgi:hypothetical protein
MTAFQFMANAFYLLVGVACAGGAALIVAVVLACIRNIIKGGRGNGKPR